MKNNPQDTPPSSLNGDEIVGVGEELYNMFDDVDGFNHVETNEVMEIDNGDMELEYEEEKEPPEDHATLVFDKHIGSVFCCDLHPEGKLAATGGEDDKAYIWSVETGQIVMDCTGHKDSIVFVGFSFDGAYLATADMAGLIKVWKVNTEENQQQPWSLEFNYEADEISWGQWHFGTRVLFFGVETGDVYMFKIPSGDVKVLKGQKAKVECGKLTCDGTKLVVGYEDGAVKTWDLKTCAVINNIPVNVHQIRVTAVDTQPQGNLVASISTDGTVVLSTSNNGKVVGHLQAGNDLETVAFSQDPLGYFALGTLEGGISIWDVSRQMLRHECCVVDDESEGVTKMIWIKEYLVTGLLDGSIRVFDSRSGELSQMITGHRAAILDLCYNAKQNIILTASDDNTARIYKYEVKDKV